MIPSPEQLLSPKHVALRLLARFDAELLAADLARMKDDWWQRHLSNYHDGGWQSISLLAPKGIRTNQHSGGGIISETEALRGCSYFRHVIDALPGEKNRVRLLRLGPGGQIFPHSDPMHQISENLIRIHVPITTNESVDFRVKDVQLRMRPGEAWFVDVRFKHAVSNLGSTPRVHLVLDITPGPELHAMLATAESSGKGYLTWYFIKHLLPVGLLRRLELGN